MLNAWLQPRRCRQTSSLLQLDTFLAGEAERGARWGGGVFEYLSRRLLNCDMELFLNPVNLSRRRAFKNREYAEASLIYQLPATEASSKSFSLC